jgi:outer membrane receptor protein involved in Fe transport
MNFGFLPVKWLQNITLTYNLTIMRSQTNIWLEQSLIDTMYTPTQYNVKGKKIADSSFIPIANYTAEMATKPMEDQPELYGNAALGYDIGGFSARISVFYQGKYTRSYSMNGTSDAVVDEFVKWDLSLKEQLTSIISLTLNVNNIFNRQETRSRYNDKFDWGYLPTSAQLYGTTIDFGVRVSL